MTNRGRARFSDSSADFAKALVRFNANVLGIAAGLMAGGGLFVATLVLVARGGDNVGSMLGLLSVFLPGYEVSVAGAFIGAAWAVLVFYAVAGIFGLFYGQWLVRELRGTETPAHETEPGRDVALLPPFGAATTTGFIGAGSLFVVHHWINLRADAPGDPLQYLALLSNYLPGYHTGFTGSLIGAAWMFVYGGVAAASVVLIYNLLARMRYPRRL